MQSDRDDPGLPLVTLPFGHASQEMVNLFLCHKAVANVFDGCMDLGEGMKLQGIPGSVQVLWTCFEVDGVILPTNAAPCSTNASASTRCLKHGLLDTLRVSARVRVCGAKKPKCTANEQEETFLVKTAGSRAV